MTENEIKFIKELEQLSRKYKISIGGCGCCGSPYLDALEDKELSQDAGYAYEDHLEWISEEDYRWYDEEEDWNYKDKVVK